MRVLADICDDKSQKGLVMALYADCWMDLNYTVSKDVK
jgi:hypothetical protein